MELDKNKLADDYMRDTNYIIIKDTDDLEDLEKQWNTFCSYMTIRQQRLSDDKSIEIYGLTNLRHYEQLKSKLETDLHKQVEDPEDEEETLTRIVQDPLPLVENTLDDESRDDAAEEYNKMSGYDIIGKITGVTPEDKLKDLEAEYRNYKDQPAKYQRKADDESLRIYGMTAEERYCKLKSELTPKIDPESFVGECIEEYRQDFILESNQHKSTIKRLNDTPYFTPSELIDLGVHGRDNYYGVKADNDSLVNGVSVPTWFDTYKDICMDHIFEDYSKEWIETLNNLYSDYDKIKESGDEDAINARKQSILDLGWNPEVEFSQENRIKASKRVNDILDRTIPRDIFISMDNIPEIDEEISFNEFANSVEYQPVFLVLTKGKTPIISDGIKFVTKSEYSHASITFDPKLNEVYSFNMRHQNWGFIKENLSSFKDNFITVFAFFAESGIVKKLKATVYDFANHKTNFDLRIFMNKILHINKRPSKDQSQQVCSTFVDTVLKSGGINLVGDQKIPAPSDIYNGAKSQPNKIFEVYNGIAPKYNGKKVERQVEWLMKDQKTLSINEASFINDKGDKVPKICPKCGSKVGVFLRGEPVYLCTNKECGKYFGTVQFPSKKKSVNESILPSGVTLRNATKEDSDNMFKWEMESIDKSLRDDPKIIKIMKKDVQESIKITKMIMYNNETIGMLTTDRLNDGYWYIGEIYIVKQHRNKGIGSALLKEQISKHDKIKLQVDQSNHGAIKLYKSLGFEISKKDDKNKMYVMTLDKKDNNIKESFSIVNEQKKFPVEFDEVTKCKIKYIIKGMPSDNPKYGPYNESVEESYYVNEVIQDIKNGVNPYSSKKFYHISFDDDLDGKILKPRVPTWMTNQMKDEKSKKEFIKSMEDLKNKNDKNDEPGPGYEEYKTPRVCGSNSIEGCLNAIVNGKRRMNLAGKQIHVYVPEKPLSEYKIKTNREIKHDGDIFDANITNEIWILEPVKMKYIGSIVVDKVITEKLKKFANDKNKTIVKYIYKWHWFHKLKYDDHHKKIKESFSFINEQKKFPVEFDEDGNLIIYKCKMGNISYGDEIDDSSELLTMYKNTSNIEGAKYELSKLWFLIDSIEKKMNKRPDSKTYNDLTKNRATAINIFKQNIEWVMKVDKTFNFAEYYHNTPFSDNSVKITNNTLKYSYKALKNFMMK